MVLDFLLVFIHSQLTLIISPHFQQEGSCEFGGLAQLLLNVSWLYITVHKYGTFMVGNTGDVCHGLHKQWPVFYI